MATDLLLWKKSRVLWMKKHDPVSYRYWKEHLGPAIGQSIHRATYAKFLLGRSRLPHFVDPTIEKVYEVIANDMQRYETMVGASITLDFLRQLAEYRLRRLKAYRRSRRSAQAKRG